MKLNAKNLLCPMPVIKTQNKIAEMHPGEILEVSCTDPGAKHDIPAWCRVHGHEVLQINSENSQIVIKIKIN